MKAKTSNNKPNSNGRPAPVQGDLQNEIQLRAHQIWLADGGHQGRALEHWLQAEQEIVRYYFQKGTR